MSSLIFAGGGAVNCETVKCDAQVQDHADRADAFRRNAEKPVGRDVLRHGGDKHAFEIQNVAHGKDKPRQHAGNGVPFVHTGTEDAQEDDRKQGRGGEPEGERHHLGYERRRIGSEIARDRNGHGRGDARPF